MGQIDDLDRIDAQILAELQKDARLSNKELAGRVGLAPSTTLERVRRLESRGVLRGFHADVLPEALGIGIQALVAVKLRQHSRGMAAAFWEHVAGLPQVIAAYHVAGANDYLLQVAVADPEHLRDFNLDALTAREEVAHVETALVFDVVRRWVLPDFVERE